MNKNIKESKVTIQRCGKGISFSSAQLTTSTSVKLNRPFTSLALYNYNNQLTLQKLTLEKSVTPCIHWCILKLY